MNIGSLLTKAAATAPDRTAIIYGDQRRTYAQFNERATRLADGLRSAGVKKGDRVAVLQRNCPELLESLFAIFKAGAVAVPINARLHPKEYGYILSDSGSVVLILTDGFCDGLASVRGELSDLKLTICIGAAPEGTVSYETVLESGSPDAADAETAADDLCWLFYTSGTTGKPKGAMVTHGNMSFMTDQYPKEVYRLGPDDVVMHPGPLTHGSGLWAVPITAGAATQLIPSGSSFDPDEIFRLIETHKVTKIAFIAPTMITMLLNAPTIGNYDLGSLRFIGYGGSPMYVEDLKRAIDRFGPVFCQIFGQGETPMTISMLSPKDHRAAWQANDEDILGSAGRIRDGITVAVLDAQDKPLPNGEIGEIALQGPSVMKGYWNKPEATEEAFRNGWYHTGDLGRINDDGFIFLMDRKKEMIISGGANVYPREVEEVLLLHPGVLEVAVIGLPDRLWGETVMAVVRARPGKQPTEAELVELCREHLAGYKKPKDFRFMEDLPKSGYGKILKRELKDMIVSETVAAQ